MNLLDISKEKGFDTEEKCIAYLEKIRWPEGVRCLACGNPKISRFDAKGRTGKIRHLYQCLEKTCRYQFSATTGTVFHDSHLPLCKWFAAIALVGESKEGISANQLRLALGVQYKTAQHIAHRIREAMQKGTIEVGESNVGVEQYDRGGKPAPGVQPAVGLREGRGRAEAGILVRGVNEGTAKTPYVSHPIPSDYGRAEVHNSVFDNMLSMFTSMAQMTIQPPLVFANYLITKVFT